MSDIVERLLADKSEPTIYENVVRKIPATALEIEAAHEIARLRAALESERVWEAADPTAQTGPLTAGQRIVAWWETATVAEPCELAQKIDRALESERERCATLAANWGERNDVFNDENTSFSPGANHAEKFAATGIAASIRALPPPEGKP